MSPPKTAACCAHKRPANAGIRFFRKAKVTAANPSDS
jgi:hypothetical protein